MAVHVLDRATARLVATARVPVNVVPNYVNTSSAITYVADAPDANGTVAAGMGYAVVAALAADPAGGLRLIASGARAGCAQSRDKRS